VAQAAEYARVYHTETPGLLQQELARAGLMLRKGRRQTRKDEYPACFPEVVKVSLDAILKSGDVDAEDAGQALRKLALLNTVAIPLDLLTAQEKRAVNLLQEHSLVTVDDKGNAAMHALTQRVVREHLTSKAQRTAILTQVAAVLQAKLAKFDHEKPVTYFIGRRYVRHASTVAAHACAWGLVPEGGGKERRAPAVAGGAGSLLDSIFYMCDQAGHFFRVVAGQPRDALGMYQMTLDCAVAEWGQGHPNVAACYGNIGSVYWKQGDCDNALVQHQKALEIQLRVLGSEHPDVAASYSNIGSVYSAQGKYDVALLQYQQSLEIRLRVLGSEHPGVATLYHKFGNVYMAQGKYDESLLQYQKGLEIELRVLGSEHPDVAASYSNIGNVYSAQGKYDEALLQCQKSLEIELRVLGSEHTGVAASYNNIGSVYRAQGKHDESLLQYQQSLEISNRMYGHVHPAVASTKENIGLALKDMDKQEEAKDMFTQAAAARRTIFGADHALTMKSERLAAE